MTSNQILREELTAEVEVLSSVFRKAVVNQSNEESFLFDVTVSTGTATYLTSFFSKNKTGSELEVGKKVNAKLIPSKEPEKWPATLRIVKRGGAGGGGGYKRNERAENSRVALKVASEVYFSGKLGDKVKITDIADRLLEWLNKNSDL